MLTVGQKFPEFKLTAVVGNEPSNAFKELSNADFDGKWLCVFFWPKDFTFICPTEIAAFDKLHDDFADRDCASHHSQRPGR